MTGTEDKDDSGGAAIPRHDAMVLTRGGDTAQIVLRDQEYTLRITRAGKLILTK
ncbi:MAG: hemin uptake protein HemP [Roseivivax sp.]|nr:hemin uptake protein HemP [Roseivivax sp.]